MIKRLPSRDCHHELAIVMLILVLLLLLLQNLLVTAVGCCCRGLISISRFIWLNRFAASRASHSERLIKVNHTPTARCGKLTTPLVTLTTVIRAGTSGNGWLDKSWQDERVTDGGYKLRLGLEKSWLVDSEIAAGLNDKCNYYQANATETTQSSINRQLVLLPSSSFVAYLSWGVCSWRSAV